MNRKSPIPLARTYRATILPGNIAADEAELRADQGVLPFVQLRAANAGIAEQLAHGVTGRPVIRVERRDDEVPA